jgi:DNA polymerase
MPKSPYMTNDFKKEVARYALNDAKNTFMLWKEHGHKMPKHEWRISRMTREMGMRGVPVNMEKLKAAEAKLIERKEFTEKLLPWIGVKYPPLSLQAIREQCEKEGIRAPKSFAEKDPEGAAWEAEFTDKFPWVRAVRDYRKANKHLKTVQAMIARTRPDGRMGYELKFFGAHTGRDSGGGGWNAQNIPKGEVAGVDIRNLIEAPEGKTLVICDLAQIEARCLPYLAEDTELLKLIASGIDIYEAHARATMGYTDPRPLKDVDPKMRFLAKARVLGLGYGCGAEKFQMVAKMLAGLDISLLEAQEIVKSYRESSPLIVALWKKFQSKLIQRTERNFSEDGVRLPNYLPAKLPSGRTLIYRNLRFSGGSNIIAKLPRNGKMMDVKLYGGLLAENCLAGGTQVLTQERGWVSLEDITASDLVWDGEEFVAHQGLIHKGSKPVIEMDGIVCTPDHLFMTDKSGWASASAICAGYYTVLSLQHEYSKQAESLEALRSPRKENRTFNSGEESGKQRRPHRMGSEVRLREHDRKNSKKPQPARHLLKTMSDPSCQYLKETSDTWNDEASRLQYLEKHDRSMPTSVSSILAQLRGAWDQGLSRVAKGLSKLLGRHGVDLQKGFVLGSNRQQRRIPQGELPMGNPSSSSQEHKTFRNSCLGARCSQQERSKEEHLVLQDSSWSSSGGCLHSEAGCHAEVYDILNCGPRSRFAVRTPLGKIYLAHNCTQALARDVFMDRCMALEDAGYEILMRIHDEVVVLVDEEDAEDHRATIEEIMSTPPIWASDLPLGAEAIISKHYRK